MENSEKLYCNGICIMGWELIEGAMGVAYAHPECELHSPYAGMDKEIPEETPDYDLAEEPHSWSDENESYI